MPAHSRGFWSTALGAGGYSRVVRLSAAAVVVLLAVGAGGAVGLDGRRPVRHPGFVGVGESPSKSSSPSEAGRQPGSATTIAPATPTTLGPGGPSTSTTVGAVNGPASGSTTTTTPTGAPSPAGSAPSTTQPQQLPPTGSYTYRTSGSQTVSAGVGNFTTPYPSQTRIAVARSGCGETETWNSSSGSSTQTYLCPVTGGLRVYYQQSSEYGNTVRFNCASDAFIPVTIGTPGEQWRFSCTSSPPGTTAAETVTFKGATDKTVGSQVVHTVQVEIDSVFSGNDSGTATADYWLTSNATLVEETGSIDVTSRNPAGKYTSNYALELTSLRPS